MTPVTVLSGDSAIVLGQPHGGTFVPDDILIRLNQRGQGLDDTDWHIHQLYDGLLDQVTVVQSHVHRYVIDANRDPSGVSLYPGQNTTGLVPMTDFDGHPIWAEGQAPSDDEIALRRDRFHAPYHAALAEELDRVRALHGAAILYDCHSIRSNIPFLFEGELPHFNIGTNSGATCDPRVETAVRDVCESAKGYTTVTNGRFRGGWTTRHYGRPETGIHAIQMELAQRAYMDEAAPWRFRPDLAARIRPHLKFILARLDDLVRSGALSD